MFIRAILLLFLLSVPLSATTDATYESVNKTGALDESEQKYFNRHFEKLKRELPSKLNVTLYFEEIKEVKAYAYTTVINHKKGVIVIDYRQTTQGKLECLIHEWAHIISYPDATHGEVWGKNYSKCFRCIMGDD